MSLIFLYNSYFNFKEVCVEKCRRLEYLDNLTSLNSINVSKITVGYEKGFLPFLQNSRKLKNDQNWNGLTEIVPHHKWSLG